MCAVWPFVYYIILHHCNSIYYYQEHEKIYVYTKFYINITNCNCTVNFMYLNVYVCNCHDLT